MYKYIYDDFCDLIINPSIVIDNRRKTQIYWDKIVSPELLLGLSWEITFFPSYFPPLFAAFIKPLFQIPVSST